MYLRHFLRNLLMVASLSAVAGLGCAPPRSSRVVIGSKNFTEQAVVGELLAQEIEAVSHHAVERRFYLAGSYICQQALVGGRIDAYVEYTGTALTAILKRPPVRDRSVVLATVQRLYRERYGITVGPPLGFNDTFAMVVTPTTAADHGITTLSGAKEAARQWKLGVGYEFEERPDGLHGMEQAYGLHFSGEPRVMDLGLLYRSLRAGQVDIIAGNSTDGPIQAFGLQILTDDRGYFPPYEAVPLVRTDALQMHPEIGVALQRLAGQVSDEEIRAMNDAVDRQHQDITEVVRRFRERKGL